MSGLGMVILGFSQGISLPLVFAAISTGCTQPAPAVLCSGSPSSLDELASLLQGNTPQSPYRIDTPDPRTISIHENSGGFPGIMQGGLVGAMGLGLLVGLTSKKDLLIPPFELSVRLLGPIEPGTTVLATDFQPEDPNQRKGLLGGYGVSVASQGDVLARIVWQRLEAFSDDFSAVLEGTDQADDSFHCLPNCFSAGVKNPIGLKRTIFFSSVASGLSRLWADLDHDSGTDLRAQMVIGDELGWWMGAALMGTEGVTHAYTYRVMRYPEATETPRVVALRPAGKVRRIVSVPLRIVNPQTGEGLAAMDVKFIGRQDAASAGMGEQADLLGQFREERIKRLQSQNG